MGLDAERSCPLTEFVLQGGPSPITRNVVSGRTPRTRLAMSRNVAWFLSGRSRPMIEITQALACMPIRRLVSCGVRPETNIS